MIRLANKEIIISRGDTGSVVFRLFQADGTPFILKKNAYLNPVMVFVMTASGRSFNLKKDMLISKFLVIDDYCGGFDSNVYPYSDVKSDYTDLQKIFLKDDGSYVYFSIADPDNVGYDRRQIFSVPSDSSQIQMYRIYRTDSGVFQYYTRNGDASSAVEFIPQFDELEYSFSVVVPFEIGDTTNYAPGVYKYNLCLVDCASIDPDDLFESMLTKVDVLETNKFSIKESAYV